MYSLYFDVESNHGLCSLNNIIPPNKTLETFNYTVSIN